MSRPRPRRGYFLPPSSVPPTAEPSIKRAVAFVDGQNLYRAAKAAFGYTWPNYRFPELAAAVSELKGWELVQTRFYTGIPKPHYGGREQQWHTFWTRKLLIMRNRGVYVYARSLAYQRSQQLADGSAQGGVKGREKGIDVRIALDVIRLALQRAYDVAILFTQDQDLSELSTDIREVAREQRRWIKMASAYPWSERCPDARGIRNSDWIRIERSTYEACLDPDDHRKPPSNAT